MSESLSIDTDRLAVALPGLTELSSHVNAILSDLTNTLGQLGECWGDDAAGRQFLEQYKTPMESLLTGMRETGKVLDSTADGVETMMKGFSATERGNILPPSGLGDTAPGEPHTIRTPHGKP